MDVDVFRRRDVDALVRHAVYGVSRVNGHGLLRLLGFNRTERRAVSDVYAYALLIIWVLSTVDVFQWARASGYGLGLSAVLVLLAWIVIGFSWMFLVWATDPNYPERLLTGRLLFAVDSILLYGANVWMLWSMRRASGVSI